MLHLVRVSAVSFLLVLACCSHHAFAALGEEMFSFCDAPSLNVLQAPGPSSKIVSLQSTWASGAQDGPWDIGGYEAIDHVAEVGCRGLILHAGGNFPPRTYVRFTNGRSLFPIWFDAFAVRNTNPQEY